MCWNALYFEILPCFNPPVQESNEVVVNIANGYKTIFATIPIVESCIAWSFQVLTCPPRAPLKFYVCFTFYLVVCPCLELTILIFLCSLLDTSGHHDLRHIASFLAGYLQDQVNSQFQFQFCDIHGFFLILIFLSIVYSYTLTVTIVSS